LLSACVIRYGPLVSNAGIIGVQTEFTSCAPLPEQIPTLIQENLQMSKTLLVGLGCNALCLPLKQLVLFAGQLIDPVTDISIVHDVFLRRPAAASLRHVWAYPYSGHS
jgi:hypothetical protein